MSEWIHDYYRAVDTMDMDGYLAWHTDDVRFRFGNGPTTTGRDAIREALSQFCGNDCRAAHEFVTGLGHRRRDHPRSHHRLHAPRRLPSVVSGHNDPAPTCDLVADIRIFMTWRRSSPGGTAS